MTTEISVLVITGSPECQTEGYKLFMDVVSTMRTCVDSWNQVKGTDFALSVNQSEGVGTIFHWTPPKIILSRLRVGDDNSRVMTLRLIAQRMDSFASNPLYAGFLIDRVRHQEHRDALEGFLLKRELETSLFLFYDFEEGTHEDFAHAVFSHLLTILEALTE